MPWLNPYDDQDQRAAQYARSYYAPSPAAFFGNLTTARTANPDPALANAEHYAFNKYVGSEYGLPGKAVMAVATPAYNAAKAVAQWAPQPVQQVINKVSPVPLTQSAGASPASWGQFKWGMAGLTDDASPWAPSFNTDAGAPSWSSWGDPSGGYWV